MGSKGESSGAVVLGSFIYRSWNPKRGGEGFQREGQTERAILDCALTQPPGLEGSSPKAEMVTGRRVSLLKLGGCA